MLETAKKFVNRYHKMLFKNEKVKKKTVFKNWSDSRKMERVTKTWIDQHTHFKDTRVRNIRGKICRILRT